MELRCFAFDDNTVLPPRFRRVNPPLDISGVPAAAKSLALIMHDPDGVSGDFVHWTIWDIAPDTTEILEGHIPARAVEGPTSAGTPGYFGPRPPKGSGVHHYIFELYALDILLDLLPATSANDVRRAMQNHIIAQTTLTGVVDAQ